VSVITILTFISASKLQDGFDVTLVADVKDTNQYIVCHVMCDDIGEFGGLVLTSFANIP
jgi:Mg2+/Co2+ transporter CorC